MAQKTLAERQAAMRERLAHEQLNNIAGRIIEDSVKHTPAEPLPPTLPAVDWQAVLQRSTEPELPLKRQKTPPIEARLFTMEEAGFYLGVSGHAVRRFVDMGELPSVIMPSTGKKNKRRMVDLRDLEKFVELKKETKRDSPWWRRAY